MSKHTPENHKIYLDNNATTRVDPAVVEKMSPFWYDLFGNSQSQHCFGQETLPFLEKARDQIYRYCHASDEDTICITSGATESINTIHRHFLDQYLSHAPNKNQIITSSMEHPSMRESLKYLTKYGIEIISLEYVDHTTFIDQFLSKYKPEKTLLISMTLAHHETGIILPIKDLLGYTTNHKTPFHLDTTQYFGKMILNLHELPIDFLSFSGHKFHAPKGIGGLFIKNHHTITPLLHGSLQMANIRSGTLNVPYIIGMREALAISEKNYKKNTQHISNLKKTLENFFLSIPNTTIYGIKENRLPNTIFVKIANLDHNYLAWFLNQHQIAVSTGAACESINPESTIKAPIEQGVRFSLSKFNTLEEIQHVISVIKTLIK